MEKEQFNKLMDSINSIGKKLDTLVALQKSLTPKRDLSAEEKKVLSLCNGKNTNESIAQKTGKTKDNVRATISNLRSKGLVESKKIGEKNVHSRV